MLLLLVVWRAGTLRSTFLLWALLILIAIIPTFGTKNYVGTVIVHALLLIVPAIACCVAIVLMRIGIVDYVNGYLYRTPWLVGFALVLMLGTVILKVLCRAMIFNKLRRLVRLLENVVLTIVDLLVMAAIVVGMLNFTTIVAF